MTAHDLIKASLRLIGALDSGQSPEASMSIDGLEALNVILDFWSAQSLMVYAQTSEALTLTSSSSYTIGSGGTLNTTRPDQILGATITSGGVDHPVSIMDPRQYRDIGLKNQGATPSQLLYVPEYPLGKIYFNSVPTAGDTLNLDSLKPLTEPAELTTSISMPPGYERCIKFNLAVDMYPEYGRQIDPIVYKIAEDTKTDLMAKNASARAQTAKIDILETHRRWSIDGG